MSGLMLCNRSSKTPYYIPELEINVYSIEELAYFLYNHTYLVGKDFFNHHLIEFIETSLELEQLADDLSAAVNANVSMPNMVYMILKASRYYSKDELNEAAQTLSNYVTKSTQERFKVKADMFYKYNKFSSALHEYYRILEMKREPGLTSAFYAQIVNNIAVIYSKLYLFEDAEKYFRKAYELHHDREYLKRIVLVGMVIGGEQKLLENIVKFDIPDDFVEECREMFNTISDESKATQNDMGYVNSREMIEKWKDDYRELMV